jgi:hypothetical protein
MNIIHHKELSSNRYQRWKLILEEYDYKLMHINGKENTGADWFSRNLTIKKQSQGNKKRTSNEENIPCTRPSIRKMIEKGGSKTEVIIGKDVLTLWETHGKIILPISDSQNLIKELHEFFVHPGGSKLYNTIKNYINAYKLKDLCKQVASECLDCQRNKHFRNNHGLLKGTLLSTKPWNKLSSDILGRLRHQILILQENFIF